MRVRTGSGGEANIKAESNLPKKSFALVGIVGSNDGLIASFPKNGVEILSQLSHLEQLDLTGRKTATDAVISPLLKCRKLKVLLLSNTAITDESVGAVAALTNLRRLDLRDTKITDAGVQSISDGAPGLKSLLVPASCSDDGLKRLLNQLELEQLAIYSHQLSDPLVESLNAEKSLRSLRVCGARDDSLREMSRLHQIEELILDVCHMTPSGLAGLDQLPKLRHLNLSNSEQLGDRHVDSLSSLSRLVELRLGGQNSVSENAIMKLHKALPECGVYWKGRIYRHHDVDRGVAN